MTRGRRDPSLDIARGIAIVMVVLGHVLGGLLDAGIGQPPPGTDRFVVALYVTHLPVFAFVTGLLMPGAGRQGGVPVAAAHAHPLPLPALDAHPGLHRGPDLRRQEPPDKLGGR
ncbi:MAG: acyltransferase family protein, partial [Actinomycetales bacterium]|nr:acyltransferase family protein [Actinomycetales bacterium]